MVRACSVQKCRRCNQLNQASKATPNLFTKSHQESSQTHSRLIVRHITYNYLSNTMPRTYTHNQNYCHRIEISIFSHARAFSINAKSPSPENRMYVRTMGFRSKCSEPLHPCMRSALQPHNSCLSVLLCDRSVT